MINNCALILGQVAKSKSHPSSLNDEYDAYKLCIRKNDERLTLHACTSEGASSLAESVTHNGNLKIVYVR